MSTQDTKRIFIAFNIPDDFKREISLVTQELAKNNDHIRWVEPEIMHITLFFLGELNEEEIARARLAMQSLANKFKSFVFGCGKAGAFPNYRRPRVIFLECVQKNGNSVLKFQKLLGDQLRQNGIAADNRPWRAHITLGRVKDPGANTPCRMDDAGRPAGAFDVDTYDLMCSKLRREGPEYTTLEKYNLIVS